MRRRLTKKSLALFALLALVLALAVLELVARRFVNLTYNNITEEKNWALELHTNLFGQYDRQPEVLIDGRMVPFAKPPGKKRLICLGSSSTYGAGLADRSKAFPGLLARAFPQAEVYNCGFGGYNSYQLWIYLSEVLVKLRPDVVIFYYGGNEGFGDSAKSFYPRAQKIVTDFKQLGVLDPALLRFAVYHGTANWTALQFYRVAERSRLFVWLRNAVITARINAGYINSHKTSTDLSAQLPPHYDKILHRMAMLLRERKTELIFAPEVCSALVYANPDVAHEMLKICSQGFADCLDATAIPDGLVDAQLFLDSSHLSEVGHQRLARLLEPLVRDALAAEKPTAAP